MADRHRLHALRTVLMALSLATVLLAVYAVGRLVAPPPAAAIPATTPAAAPGHGCARGEAVRGVVGRA